MGYLRVQHLVPFVVFLSVAAGAAAPQSPGAAGKNDNVPSAFTFQVTEATVTRARQMVWTGMKFDDKSGAVSLTASPMRPKVGRVFVLLKLAVRNDGAHTDKVVYEDLVIKGKDGQRIRPLVLLESKPVPIYTANATAGREVAPNASDTDELLLDVPRNPGVLTLQYRSLSVVPIEVSPGSRSNKPAQPGLR